MAEQEDTQVQAPAQPASKGGWTWGTGRRKKAVARVRVKPGSGQFMVNRRQVQEYFTEEADRRTVAAPLAVGNVGPSLEVHVSVGGGGPTGQAGAVALGLARAIAKAVPEMDRGLRDQGLLTRDARMKERKKYGQKGARKRFQFSKR